VIVNEYLCSGSGTEPFGTFTDSGQMTPFTASRCATVIAFSLTVAAVPLAGQNCPEVAGKVDVLGQIIDPGSGIPLPGANAIVTWEADGGGRISAVSDALGRFSVCGVPAGVALSVSGGMGPFAGVPIAIDPSETGVEVVVPLDLSAEPRQGSVATREVAGASGRIVGRVRDVERDRPVANALVSIPSRGLQGITDNAGVFALADLPSGAHTLQIQGLGYRTLTHEIRVPQAATVQVDVAVVPDPIELEPIVTTVVRYRVPESRGFYERKDWSDRTGLGAFMTREDIRRMNPQRITHVLAQLPGIRLDCSGGVNQCYARMRGSSPTCTGPNVYVDGVRVLRDNQRTPEPIDMVVLPVEVVGIEVYGGPSEVPGEFMGADAQCGAILFWTSANADG
jgi:hypothetical protein